MTNKDLNLALDQDLLQAGNAQRNNLDHTHNPNHNEHDHSESITASKSTVHSSLTGNHSRSSTQPSTQSPSTSPATPSTKPSKAHIGQRQHSVPGSGNQATKTQPYLWLSMTLLSINLIFLLLAGIWLSTHQYSGVTTGKAGEESPIQQQVTDQLVPLNDQLLKLQQQVDQLQLSIHAQQQLIATGANDVTQALQSLSAEQTRISALLKTTSAKPVMPETAKAAQRRRPEKSAPTENWHVNLGTFSTREAALRMKKQLLALGHSVQIDNTSFENKAAYRVQLPGFSDRASAERTAKQIMDKTKLNGLWAWKDE